MNFAPARMMAYTWSPITAAPTTGALYKNGLIICARRVEFSVLFGNGVFCLSN